MSELEIYTIRKKLNMTQAQFGKMLGKGLRTVQMWEKGKRKMNKTTEMLLKSLVAEYERSADSNNMVKDIDGTYNISSKSLDELIKRLSQDINFRKEVYKLIDDYMIANEYTSLKKKK